MIATTGTAAGARVTRLVYDGAVYFPIVRAGAVLGPEEVAELAAASAPAPTRRFLAIVADESTPREGLPLDLEQFAPPAAVPLTYGDSIFRIGVIEKLQIMPGAAAQVGGAQGSALIGIGRLADNALAAIAWPAIRSGLLRGLCADVEVSEEDGRNVVQQVRRVTIGGVENNCLATAIVMNPWEGESDG
jgi:hypothetical protein